MTKHRRTYTPRRQPPRGGFLMLTALVCVALAVGLAGLLARIAVVDMQYDRTQRHRMQCEWLAEAGVERAVARLAAEPDFAGETWHIAPEQLDGRHAAVVRTAVEPDPERPGERIINVQADFPDDPHRRVRHARTVRLATVPRGLSQFFRHTGESAQSARPSAEKMGLSPSHPARTLQ